MNRAGTRAEMLVFDADANCRYTHGVGGDCNNRTGLRCAHENVIVLLSKHASTIEPICCEPLVMNPCEEPTVIHNCYSCPSVATVSLLNGACVVQVGAPAQVQVFERQGARSRF